LAGAALCGAGPLRDDGSIALTNHACVVDPAALSLATRLPKVHVANDFEAIAHALPAFTDADLQACGGSTEGDTRAPRIVLGAGTGLGIGSLVRHRDDWLVLPGEGGHVDLAPVDDEEHALWLELRARHGALSAESLLSGPGLERLHDVSAGQKLTGPEISDAARSGDARALKTIEIFTRWFGRVAANATLTLGARGGVYLAGGIVPGWGALFDPAVFRNGFEANARFHDWLAAIPAWVVTHPQPALIGLARLAESA
jgi:glucokinase